MTRNQVQRERMRAYFVEAAKELLKGEGLRAVSVRAVAERAGYSYATLYNHFRDVKDLVFLCVRDFQEECRVLALEEARGAERGAPKLKALLRSYVRYFVQYPGTFELFFLEGINDIGAQQGVHTLIHDFPDLLCQDEWAYCIEHRICGAGEARLRRDCLRHALTGMLLFYLNRRIPDGYEEFMRRVDAHLDALLPGAQGFRTPSRDGPAHGQ